jgi:hypothetical protein
MFFVLNMVPQIITELSGAATEKGKVALITKAVFRPLKTMSASVYRPLQFIAFNANGIGRQAYEVSKHLLTLKNRSGPVLTDIPETSYGVLYSKL